LLEVEAGIASLTDDVDEVDVEAKWAPTPDDEVDLEPKQNQGKMRHPTNT
jgi:hypothetical protein